jgi:hypothetical protein
MKATRTHYICGTCNRHHGAYTVIGDAHRSKARGSKPAHQKTPPRPWRPGWSRTRLGTIVVAP